MRWWMKKHVVYAQYNHVRCSCNSSGLSPYTPRLDLRHIQIGRMRELLLLLQERPEPWNKRKSSTASFVPMQIFWVIYSISMCMP